MDAFQEDKCVYKVDGRGGFITLTIDGGSPIYIFFEHSVKVQVKLNPMKSTQLSSVARDGDVDEVANPNIPLLHEQTPLLTASNTLPAESVLDQALALQDIDKLVKGKMAKEQKLEKTINKVNIPAIRTSLRRQAKAAQSAADVILTIKVGEKVVQDSPVAEDQAIIKSESESDSSEEDQTEPDQTEPDQTEVTDCQYCFQSFNNRLEFFNHRKPKPESHRCETCRKMFPYRAYLLAHVKKHHPAGGQLLTPLEVCDVCGLKLKNFLRVKKHMLLHTGEYPYKCCICSKNIAGFGALNTHMASHKNAGMVKCTCCNQIFSSRSDLSKHQLNLLQIKCSLCGEVLPNRTSRTAHYQLAHPDSILTCHICSRLFSSEEELSSHIAYHSRYKKKQCTVCGKFVSRLERHILSHKAMKDVDESDLYICDKCPMRFKIKASLQRHQRCHSQERPFCCSLCPKSFAHQGVLLKHIKTHSSIAPYECEVCGKRCKEKSNLTVHMRTHSGNKAYSCQICSQGFSCKSSLEGHIKTKHEQLSPNVSVEIIQEQPEIHDGIHFTIPLISTEEFLLKEDKDLDF